MSQSDAYTDVMELCALLQCLGFSVKSLESNDGNTSQAEPGIRTIIINCQSSGLHVVLETPSANCSCPANHQQQNSGVWQVSGITGGKQLDKEFGCTLLGSLPKSHRDRLSKELHDMIRCIRQSNDSDCEKKENSKSASMIELKTPEKRLFDLKVETPTRYRSLDTLTAAKEAADPLPAPGALQRARDGVSESSVDDGDVRSENKRTKCSRQGTYTLSSSSESIRRIKNKTSSPIHAPQNSVLDNLMAAEKAAEDLRAKLGLVIEEYTQQFKEDSSVSSLALDVSRISVLKEAETSKQFASSPNLSGKMASDDFSKIRLKRFDSASTSNLTPKESKISRLRRISPSIFTKKESPSVKVEKVKSQDSKSKLNSLFRPRIITPTRTYKLTATVPEPSPNLSSSSKKKYSHVKSTIPKPAKKE